MAVKRAGTVFTSRKKTPLGWLLWLLEKFGKPLYWIFFALFFLFGHLGLGLGKFSFWLSRQIKRIHLPRFPRLRFKKRKGRPKIPKVKKPKVPRLKRKPPRRKISVKKLILILAIVAFFALVGFFAFTIFYQLPDPYKLVTREQIVSTKIYDRKGELLYKIYRNQNRSLIKLEELPLYLIQATVAVEDAEFYSHRGFSWKAILRAALKNLEGNKLYGGSTITQQLVKNALLTPERTWRRKLKEIVLSLLVETKFTKDEILQMYLNEVGYGGAAYGVEEAAQIYLDKSAKDLTLAQAALLAGLPASPTTFSPFGAYPEKAKERQEFVLFRMRQEGFITEAERKKAVEEAIRLAPQRTDIKAPHFVMYVKEVLAQTYGGRMVEEGGLEVKTSLDLKLQQEVEKIVKNEVDQLQRLRISNGAALVTSPQTGEILAMVGSKDYFEETIDGNVNVTLRPRQPGSSIKPVNYAVALQ
ncbi:penicillin-binding protein, partial [Candidatus Shapirobacteria bacterium]|nr:penicillin-binding protein [Candidatus Shapirobacteria bacterium]